MDVDIRLEQSLASVVRYIHNHADIKSHILFDEIPEGFEIPTIYFQPPRTKSRKVTLSSYRTDFTMRCWFMCASPQDAYIKAASVRDCILLDDCTIPIMEKDGTLAGGALQVYDLNVQDIDTGIEELVISFSDYFVPDNDYSVKIQKFTFNGLIPPDAAYLAWEKAVSQIKKEEEAQKECLNRVIAQTMQ